MEGYDERSYGDAFADVYDDWYGSVTDIDATASTMASFAAGHPQLPVLELGIGTGRLALALAARGVAVVGIDSSAAMLDRLRIKPGAEAVTALEGDMVDDLPAGPFAAAFVAYNTLFNLRTAERQLACFTAVAHRLPVGGHFAVEAFVPDTTGARSSEVRVRSLAAGRVVLSVSQSDPALQTAEGHYIDITEAGGVKLRPWSIRWSSIAELDRMAVASGLELVSRWEDFARTPFTTDSERHVSVWRRR
jgi:SAM-dependent methyltransferase